MSWWPAATPTRGLSPPLPTPFWGRDRRALLADLGTEGREEEEGVERVRGGKRGRGRGEEVRERRREEEEGEGTREGEERGGGRGEEV